MEARQGVGSSFSTVGCDARVEFPADTSSRFYACGQGELLRMNRKFHWAAIQVLLAVFVSMPIEAASGQQQGLDFGHFGDFTPDAVMDTLFGPPSEAELELLDKVKVSDGEERRFGEQLVANYIGTKRQQGVTIRERGAEVDYLEKLVAKLRPEMRHARRYRQIRVLLADTDDTDAYSFPGGTLVFTRGLIEFCESEAALLGVVGHELSHLDRGHQLVPLKRSRIAQSTFSGRQQISPQAMMQQMQVLTRAWTRPFRPEEELEADQDAATWMLASGYEPRELVRLMESWQRKNRDKNVNIPAFLRSHPYTENRVEIIEDVREAFLAKHSDAELQAGRESFQQWLRGR